MSKQHINLGATPEGKPLQVDLEVLMETRLLIQANSGGGKSYLLRRLAEQAFGKLPVIIIDPEGEFASLREKFGFVLVGEGGETPAHPATAREVAEKLLTLQASAVCDLLEAFRRNPQGRQEWVKAFLESFIDAPKSLWRDTLLIIDEAQLFCPQDGDSACHDAMVSLNTVGRKRGFCPVWASQRLALIDKDASSQLLNRIVGMTFEDVDVKRAVNLLSVGSDQVKEFTRQIRTLNQGDFFAFGRAISRERILFHGGAIQTTHPKRGGRKTAGPPPTPDSIKEFLPQLSDLPQQAEARARTEKELRAEIREQAGRIRQLEAEAKKALSGPQAVRLSAEEIRTAGDRARAAVLREWEGERKRTKSKLEDLQKHCAAVVSHVERELALYRQQPELPAPPPQPGPTKQVQQLLHRVADPMPPFVKNVPAGSNGDLTGPERRILNAIAWLNSIGVEAPEQTAVAFLAGYTCGGGAFNNPRGALRSRGLVEYVAGERIRLTAEGQANAAAPDAPLTVQELHQRVLERLPGPETKILSVLLEAYPNALSNEDLARQAGYEPGGGAFNNPRGRLRSLGLIEYPGNGTAKARDILFLEGR